AYQFPGVDPMTRVLHILHALGLTSMLFALLACNASVDSSGPSPEAMDSEQGDEALASQIDELATPNCQDCPGLCRIYTGVWRTYCLQSCASRCITRCDQCKNACLGNNQCIAKCK